MIEPTQKTSPVLIHVVATILLVHFTIRNEVGNIGTAQSFMTMSYSDGLELYTFYNNFVLLEDKIGNAQTFMRMSHSDELELNPFYNHVLNRQRYLHEVLVTGGVLCIPVASSIQKGHISDVFTDLHILKPSPLYKGEYSTVYKKTSNNQPLNITWDQTNKTLVSESSGATQILYSENAYLQKVKYTVLLIERPLHSIRSQGVSQSTHVSSDSLTIDNTSLRHVDSYLKSLAKFKMGDLQREIRLFKSKYIVLPQFLNDAADKLENITEKFLQQYQYSKQLHYAVLSFVHHHTFDHIFRLVQETSESESNLYHQQCLHMQDESISLSDFSLPDVSALLLEIGTSTSPLQIMSLLKLTLDEICRGANVLSGAQEEMSTDDLIPVLIDVLVRSGDIDFPSLLTYVRIFGKDIMDFHEAFEFTLATYRAAVQYISDFNIEQFRQTDNLPRAEQAPQEVVNSHENINKDLDPGTFLSEYVKPFSGTQPFNYSSQRDSDPLDRYAMLACLNNYGNLL